MNAENRVAEKMQILQELFQSTKAFVEQTTDLSDVIKFLTQHKNSEFVSIAYEAVAMVLALNDLEQGKTLDTWQVFLEKYAQEHAVQVHIGLGWACGQQRLNPSLWINMTTPLLGWRIWDGYGYYDGFFRKRKVLQEAYPPNILEEELQVYWQGAGRSFWYTCKGNREKLQKISSKIPLNYQASFWRGIGIASAYVGGLRSEDCQQLWQLAATYQAQLKAGAALAIKSRVAANTVVEDTEILAREWFNLPILKIIDLLNNNAIDSTVANAAWYHTWIMQLDEVFKS
ncbi:MULTISPECIES: DUF1702 family protein [unclassified Aureispira]|uniref:DUF1702 family protein n=1 Tax=unclassified Aureispira TaxID=2649989 RepID=UPI000698EB95|nr:MULTISPECIES: DUF1702 family protein [unclassified Aureispira]WMX14615.1 DUF1702 family protein [Aureispira sp. CCB-E]